MSSFKHLPEGKPMIDINAYCRLSDTSGRMCLITHYRGLHAAVDHKRDTRVDHIRYKLRPYKAIKAEEHVHDKHDGQD